MFKEERDQLQFSWKDLGNIEEGRPNLGSMVPVFLYRLIQYTIRDVLIKRYDVKTAQDIFVEAGRLAGYEFCKNMLNKDLDYENFLSKLQKLLKETNIGILKIEKADFEDMDFTVTLAEDLDCSGLPVSNETICNYDEGFIKGILEAYTEREFSVTEINCWASGDRICRFKIDLIRL
jgi:predicted hydrocarbon binding protein